MSSDQMQPSQTSNKQPSQTSNEKPSYPPAQATLHEIRTVETSATHVLPKLQCMKASNPQLKLLDVGCGSGTISVSFAKLIPDGHVTGIDFNATILPRARAVAEMASVTNIEFEEASIFSLPFADETFDVTFCHQVLIHIGNPWDGLREMLRVTKRGGIVAAREGDYESECIWPEIPELGKFHDLMVGLMRANGGTPTAGRQLLSWALKAGAQREQIELGYCTTSYNTPSERETCAQGLCQALRGGPMRTKALKFGLGADANFEDMAQALEGWAKRDDASLAMLHGELLIHK